MSSERNAYMREYMRRRRTERPDIVERDRLAARARYQTNPELAKEASRRWREAHPEAVRRQNSARDPEAQRLRWRAYYEANAERLKERARLRRETHPEDKRRASRKRKALRASTPFTLTPAQLKELLRGPCVLCGATTNLTLGHDVPVSRGGETSAENTVCLCRSCNSRMWTRTLAEVRDLIDRGVW